MDKEYFLQLLKKWRSGKATDEEQRFLEAYYDLFELDSGVKALTDEEKSLLKKVIRAEVQQGITQNGMRGTKLRGRSLWRKVAAAVLLLLISGGVFYYLQDGNQEAELTVLNSIQSGQNKAILTLDNGKQIVLDSAAQNAFPKQSLINMSKENNTLVYAQSEKNTGKYNTITTPFGGSYKVVLADGTRVWLNAGSSLHYPMGFQGDTRSVSLKGEGYFEVTPQVDKPFIVEVNGVEIKVLGTRFNINAYPEDHEVTTTLVEGEVLVSKDGDQRRLHPGEQAKWDRERKVMSVQTVNVDQALAWRKDLFFFKDTNIKEVMKHLMRWYDVQVEYEVDDLKDKNFTGVMSRYTNIEAVLNRMELTGTIHFEVEGRVVKVKE